MIEELSIIFQPEYILLNLLCAIAFFGYVGWKIFSANKRAQSSRPLELRPAA